MTILGKVLAFLNILGATAFLFLAAMTTARVESWKYANYRHDLLRDGLPLDDKILNQQGQSEAAKVGDPKEPNQTLKELFPQNPPVNTQVMEVLRVRDLFDSKLQAENDKAKHLVLYCRCLLPLATSYQERERLILIRVNLADEGKALKPALQQGFQLALNALKKNEDRAKELAEPDASQIKRPFEQHYLEAVQTQGGPDKRPFVEEFLRILPRGGGKSFAEAASKPNDEGFLRDVRNDQAKTFQELFDAAYDELLTSLDDKLKDRWNEHFEAAIAGKVPVKTPAGPSSSQALLTPPTQTKAVARLLFDLVEVMPGAPNQPKPPRLWEDPAYKRVINVVGLQAFGKEVAAQASLYQTMIDEVNTAIKREQENFALNHQALLEQIKDRASRIAFQKALVQRNQDAADAQEKLLVRRNANVETFMEDLDKARKETADRLAELSRMETELFKIRIQVRDATRLNQEYQRKLNDLEDRVR